MKNNKQKERSIALKTMSMKSRLANFIRTNLYNFSTNDYEIKYKGKKKITDQDKIEFFDKMYPIYKEMESELRAYKDKRKEKARIQALRDAKQAVLN